VTNKNVFNPSQGGSLSIGLKSVSGGHVLVKVYNMAGELVRPVLDADVQAGLWFQASWDGKNGDGELVAAGVYFVSVRGAGIKSIRKVIVLK
jgi:flagellar hook assembly protein FlgD